LPPNQEEEEEDVADEWYCLWYGVVAGVEFLFANADADADGVVVVVDVVLVLVVDVVACEDIPRHRRMAFQKDLVAADGICLRSILLSWWMFVVIIVFVLDCWVEPVHWWKQDGFCCFVV